MCPEPNLTGTLTETNTLYGIVGVGGGTANYNNLVNKPKINNVELVGNKPLSEFGVPTKTSDLVNDSGFITSAAIPTKTSQLTNDSGFITSSALTAQNVTYESSNVKAALDSIIASLTNVIAVDTASGKPAEFSTDLAENVLVLTTEINAVQSGTGDPSPTNVREISGFNNCVITVKNGSDTTIKTITIDLGSTRYGGNLDVLTGKLTVTHGYLYLTGAATETWNFFNVSQGKMFRYSEPTKSYTVSNTNTLCNTYKPVSTRTNLTLSGSATNFDFINDDYSTVSAWKTYLNSNPIQIVYPVTNTVIDLTAYQVSTLDTGINKFESDTGNLSVKYLKTLGGLLP